jgi:hypothetical protein
MAAQDYEQVTYNSPSGAQIGQSSSELIAFHGATPVDQAAFVATVSVEGTTGGVGFSSSGHFSNAVTLLNRIQALLVEKGLMAAS